MVCKTESYAGFSSHHNNTNTTLLRCWLLHAYDCDYYPSRAKSSSSLNWYAVRDDLEFSHFPSANSNESQQKNPSLMQVRPYPSDIHTPSCIISMSRNPNQATLTPCNPPIHALSQRLGTTAHANGLLNSQGLDLQALPSKWFELWLGIPYAYWAPCFNANFDLV